MNRFLVEFKLISCFLNWRRVAYLVYHVSAFIIAAAFVGLVFALAFTGNQ